MWRKVSARLDGRQQQPATRALHRHAVRGKQPRLRESAAGQLQAHAQFPDDRIGLRHPAGMTARQRRVGVAQLAQRDLDPGLGHQDFGGEAVVFQLRQQCIRAADGGLGLDGPGQRELHVRFLAEGIGEVVGYPETREGLDRAVELAQGLQVVPTQGFGLAEVVADAAQGDLVPGALQPHPRLPHVPDPGLEVAQLRA